MSFYKETHESKPHTTVDYHAITLTHGTNPESMNPCMMTLVDLVALKSDLAAVATVDMLKNS